MTVREKLAKELCSKLGALFEAHNIHRNPAMHIRYDGVCSWSADGVLPATETTGPVNVHVCSWDTMTACVRHGFDLSKVGYSRIDDKHYEASSREYLT